MNPTHKLVLVALANFADDDLAWPRVDTLSQLTSSSRRTVFRAVDALVTAGLIERLRGCERADRGGLHRAQSVWRLRVPDSVSRRHSGRDRRPGMVRESPSQIHCDTGDTLLHTPPIW